MAEETLVDTLIADSEKLVRELDRQGKNPTNALWYFYSDAEEWRLLVAGPTFDALLPKQEGLAYQEVAKAIAAINPDSLTIADVKLIRSDDVLLKALKWVLQTPADELMRVRFRDNTFDGIFVKDMLILRAA